MQRFKFSKLGAANLRGDLFGGTPAQISSPTGPMAIVMASVFTEFGSQPEVAFTMVMTAQPTSSL